MCYMMMAFKGVFIAAAILTVANALPTAPAHCNNYDGGKTRLCVYIDSTRPGALGHGWYCSDYNDLLRLIVFVNNVEKYDHCKEGEPVPSTDMQLPPEISPEKSMAKAESCDYPGGTLCIQMMETDHDYGMFCSYEADVQKIIVKLGGIVKMECT